VSSGECSWRLWPVPGCRAKRGCAPDET
jgi:hypothetical protein